MLRNFSHKSHRKRVEENANVSFFETDNQACTGCVTTLRSVIHWLRELWSLTLE